MSMHFFNNKYNHFLHFVCLVFCFCGAQQVRVLVRLQLWAFVSQLKPPLDLQLHRLPDWGAAPGLRDPAAEDMASRTSCFSRSSDLRPPQHRYFDGEIVPQWFLFGSSVQALLQPVGLGELLMCPRVIWLTSSDPYRSLFWPLPSPPPSGPKLWRSLGLTIVHKPWAKLDNLIFAFSPKPTVPG